MGKIATLGALLILGGCAGALPPVASPRGIWCENNSPIYLSHSEIDTMSSERRQSALSHNLKGVNWCGWKPKTGQ